MVRPFLRIIINFLWLRGRVKRLCPSGRGFFVSRSFFKKEDGISVFWAVFSYFSSMDFLVLTKEDDDDDEKRRVWIRR